MIWDGITRLKYRREQLRYASDMTDKEWKILEPFMPAPCRRGRPREVDLRDIVEAILYIAATGCQWRALPRRALKRAPQAEAAKISVGNQRGGTALKAAKCEGVRHGTLRIVVAFGCADPDSGPDLGIRRPELTRRQI